MATEETLPTNRLSDKLNADEYLSQKKTTWRRKWSRRRILIFLGVSLLNVGLFALLVSQLLMPAGQGSNAASSPLIGHLAPDFTLPALSPDPAAPMHLASLKGKAVMINFWASWCTVCKQEAPLLENTWQRTQGQGIVFLGIDWGDTHNDGLNFLQHYDITYPNVTDTNGNVAITYGLTGVPETVFIDRHGIVVNKVIGELTEQTLQENLNKILQKT